MPAVLVFTYNGTITRRELTTDQSITVGRVAGCEVVIDDRQVSRRHATFHACAGGVEVEDLGSHNGTRLLVTQTGAIAETASMALVTRLAPHVRVALDASAMVHIGGALVTLEAGPAPAQTPNGIEGVVIDPAMVHLYALAERVAASDLRVLLCGETGVGKELVAQFVHRRSARASRRLIAINCAAVAHDLIEAELFGHEKGAFTGATHTTEGLLETADGGTLFLDEVAELSPAVQAKFLRVLEVGELLRIGGRTPIAIDVRYIAATHRDLGAAVADGRFREDLYYRLNGITLTIPPLRSRPAEIVPLAHGFAAVPGRPPLRFSTAAIDRLVGHAWPGNVRELRNVVTRATVLCDGAVIDADHIQLASSVVGADVTPEALRERAESLEKQLVADALEACGGNQTRTAAMLGLTRRALVIRLDKYALPRPRKRR